MTNTFYSFITKVILDDKQFSIYKNFKFDLAIGDDFI